MGKIKSRNKIKNRFVKRLSKNKTFIGEKIGKNRFMDV